MGPNNSFFNQSWVISHINLVIVLVLAIPIAVFRFTVEPVKRGFFCNDEELSHPFHENTVSNAALLSCGIGLPIVIIILAEWFLPATSAHSRGDKLKAIYSTITDHMFGLAVTVLLTDVTKYTVGRLR